jgi:hypothetical protein
MNDVSLPESLPRECHTQMRHLGLQAMTLWDPPVELPEDTRRWAAEYARRQVETIQEKIFPLHGI